LLQGLADDAILETAERLHVDLIVVGTHRRWGLSRLFMGSVAAHVVSRGRCAVLATHSQDPAPRRLSRVNVNGQCSGKLQQRRDQTATERQPVRYAR
jgi:hypothetical protein